jgi:hypothetical protein
MNGIVAIKGMAGVEHRRPDGSFVAYEPGAPRPLPIRAGDRLHLSLDLAGDTWLYAVAVTGQTSYGRLGAWPAGRAAGSGIGVLWPGGRTLSADDAAMTTLLVIASGDELPWLRDLTRTDCASVVNQMPAEPPVSVCDHLYGLFWKIPKRPRGLVRPVVGSFEDGAIRVPAIVAEHRGSPYTAIEWQFQPR